MAKLELPKLTSRVRFPSPAPFALKINILCILDSSVQFAIVRCGKGAQGLFCGMSLAGATKPFFYMQLYADAEKSASLDLLRFPSCKKGLKPTKNNS